MDIDDRGWPTRIRVGLLAALLWLAFTPICGCLGLESRIDTVEQSVALLQTDIAVGGGGDSVTAWIYALIAGAAVLYPVIWRPGRQWLARRKNGG